MKKLLVKNFLSIKKAELEINDFTILIGPQASGKSILAKLIYLFLSFPNIVFNTLVKDEGKRYLCVEAINLFKRIFPEYSWDNQNFSVTFETDYGNFIFKNLKTKSNYKLVFEYSDYYSKLFDKAKRISRKVHLDIEEAVKKKTKNRRLSRFEISYEEKLSEKLMGLDYGFDQNIKPPVFVPSGRSFFSSIESNVFSFLANNISIDHFLKEFGSTYNSAKSFFNFIRNDKDLNAPFKFDTLEKVIGGIFYQEKRTNKEWIKSTIDGRKTELSNASSGQQESLPMLLVLSVIPFLWDYKGSLYIVEEPEAHLFPSAQKQIIEMLCESYNRVDKKNKTSYLITTHSPYVLAYANILAKAGKIRKQILEETPPSKTKLDQLYKLVPQNSQIPSSKLTAYLIENGITKLIIDNNSGLINDYIIDEVSDEISSIFDDLLDLENFDEQNNQ